MDIISHGLAGALIAKSGFSQRIGPSATALGVISAVFPDVDFIASAFGPWASLKAHRGITHSFFGLILEALFLAFLFRTFGSYKRFLPLFALAFLGVSSHISFDLMTSFGTQILQPFSAERYALDWIFILDPFFTGSILIALTLGWLLPSRGRVFARAGLIVLVGYIALLAINHQVALGSFREALEERSISYQRVAAMPRPLGPFRWSGFALDDGGVYRAWFSTLKKEPIMLERFKSSPPNRYVLAARNLEEVRIYRWFARFPIETYEEREGRHVVEYSDLRFSGIGGRNLFNLRVVMDDGGRVVRVEF